METILSNCQACSVHFQRLQTPVDHCIFPTAEPCDVNHFSKIARHLLLSSSYCSSALPVLIWFMWSLTWLSLSFPLPESSYEWPAEEEAQGLLHLCFKYSWCWPPVSDNSLQKERRKGWWQDRGANPIMLQNLFFWIWAPSSGGGGYPSSVSWAEAPSVAGWSSSSSVSQWVKRFASLDTWLVAEDMC